MLAHSLFREKKRWNIDRNAYCWLKLLCLICWIDYLKPVNFMLCNNAHSDSALGYQVSVAALTFVFNTFKVIHLWLSRTWLFDQDVPLFFCILSLVWDFWAFSVIYILTKGEIMTASRQLCWAQGGDTRNHLLPAHICCHAGKSHRLYLACPVYKGEGGHYSWT